jgi:hypothetical protein
LTSVVPNGVSGTTVTLFGLGNVCSYPVVVPNGVSGTTVTWESVSGITYYLQRGTDLGAQPAFTTIQTNIAGQPLTTSYTDTTAYNGDSVFYRVGVQ